MTQLTDWLDSFPHVSDCREVAIMIKGKRYIGAAYRDSNFSERDDLSIN